MADKVTSSRASRAGVTSPSTEEGDETVLVDYTML